MPRRLWATLDGAYVMKAENGPNSLHKRKPGQPADRVAHGALVTGQRRLWSAPSSSCAGPPPPQAMPGAGLSAQFSMLFAHIDLWNELDSAGRLSDVPLEGRPAGRRPHISVADPCRSVDPNLAASGTVWCSRATIRSLMIRPREGGGSGGREDWCCLMRLVLRLAACRQR